jgi:hypothetical protein
MTVTFALTLLGSIVAVAMIGSQVRDRNWRWYELALGLAGAALIIYGGQRLPHLHMDAQVIGFVAVLWAFSRQFKRKMVKGGLLVERQRRPYPRM